MKLHSICKHQKFFMANFEKRLIVTLSALAMASIIRQRTVHQILTFFAVPLITVIFGLSGSDSNTYRLRNGARGLIVG